MRHRFSTPAASVPIVLDTATSHINVAVAAKTDSWTGRVNDHPNRVAIFSGINSQEDTYDSVKWGTQKFTLIGRGVKAQQWYLVNPDTGSLTVQLWLAHNAELVNGMVTFYNVHQSSPIGTQNNTNATGTEIRDTVVTVAGDLVVDVCGTMENQSVTPDESQTTLWSNGGNGDYAYSSSKTATTTSTPMIGTAGGSVAWHSCAVPLKRASP